MGLSSAFNKIKGTAKTKGAKGKLHTLFILCHGYAGENTAAAVSGDFGGMGLQLGTEDVLHSNVSMWTAIKGKFRNIVVYSCGAGDTEEGNEGTTADGEYLMGALALHTQAHVFAADKIQWYNGGAAGSAPIDFGAWEGNLKWFPPTGEHSKVVYSVPVEISDVYTGNAP
jgi:hypothetical protein